MIFISISDRHFTPYQQLDVKGSASANVGRRACHRMLASCTSTARQLLEALELLLNYNNSELLQKLQDKNK
jgi:hypothetical protein